MPNEYHRMRTLDDVVRETKADATERFNDVCSSMHQMIDEQNLSYCEKRKCQDCAVYKTREQVYLAIERGAKNANDK